MARTDPTTRSHPTHYPYTVLPAFFALLSGVVPFWLMSSHAPPHVQEIALEWMWVCASLGGLAFLSGFAWLFRRGFHARCPQCGASIERTGAARKKLHFWCEACNVTWTAHDHTAR